MRLTDQPYISALPERSDARIPTRFKGDACCGFRVISSPTSSLRETTPVATVSPGDQFVVETHDTSTGRIYRAEDVPEFVRIRDPRKVNPAAGPVFIKGAVPGDDLIVEILDIRLQPYGFVRVLAGAGVLQEGIEPDGVLMARIDGEHVVLGERLRLPLRPMVGVIGTAPADGVVYTAAPGPQGSNIDINAVTVGARVHLPVHVPGALLAIGDVHASMGDGEVSGTGIEIAGEVTVQVELVPGAAPARPWIETDDVGSRRAADPCLRTPLKWRSRS